MIGSIFLCLWKFKPIDMKKPLFFAPFLLLIFIFSCDVEPIDSALSGQIGNGNGNGNGNQPTQPSTGDYWPMAVGNKWTYGVVTDNQVQPDSQMEIGEYVNYDGNQQYLYTQFVTNTTATDGTMLDDISIDIYSRKNGGNYIITFADWNFESAGVQVSQTGYSYVMLKDYLGIGGTWTENVSSTTTFSVADGSFPDTTTQVNTTMTFEILNKDFTMTVNGEEFGPVIELKMEMVSNSAGQTIESEFIYYFAKDVGVIKLTSTTNDISDNVVTNSTQEIKTYNLN